MNVVGAVDGTVAHVDTVKDSVVVAVERAAYTINNDNAVDVQIITYCIILCCEPTTLDSVACCCLVGSRGVLVGVGTAVTKIDCIGHKVTVAVGTAKDGKVLHWLSIFELAVVLELGTAGVDGAVVKIIRRAIEVEIGTAVSRCEPSIVASVLNTNGGVCTWATIQTIRHTIEISIKGLTGGGIITRVGAAGVADTTLGVLVDGHSSTDIVLVVPDAAGALIKDVGDAVVVCKISDEKKQPCYC